MTITASKFPYLYCHAVACRRLRLPASTCIALPALVLLAALFTGSGVQTAHAQMKCGVGNLCLTLPPPLTLTVGVPVDVSFPVATGGTPGYEYRLFLPGGRLLDGVDFDASSDGAILDEGGMNPNVFRITLAANVAPRLIGTPTMPQASTLYTYAVNDRAPSRGEASFSRGSNEGLRVEVRANAAPTATGTIDAINAVAGDPAVTTDVANFFTDPDAAAGDTLTYSAASDDTAVATVSVSDSMVSITPVAVGSATITVTATDLVSQTATQDIVVTVTTRTDATLSALTLSAGTLTPAFASGTTSYTVSVGNDVANLTLTPTAANSAASVAVNGDAVSRGMASGAIALNVGANTVTILVTAEDGTTTETYTVTVTRASALTGLTLSEGTLSPALAAGITEYDVSVGNDVESLTVTLTAISGATVTVNDVSVASGAASDAIDLTADAVTTITVVVTVTATGDTETYTLRVTRGSGEVANRVTGSVLPHVAQAMTASTLSAITGRIDAAAGAAPPGVSGLAGKANLLQALKANQRGLEDGTIDLARALDGSSFAMPLNAAGDSGSGRAGDVAVWGSGDWRRLTGPDNGMVDWDGDMFSFHLGADVRTGAGSLAGLAISRSSGSFDYTDRGGPRPAKGSYDSDMTGVHPYASWSPTEDSMLWATVGYGRGEIAIDEDGGERRSSDTEMKSAAVGGSHVLVSDDGLVPGGAATLRLKGEGALARIDVEGGDAIRPVEFDVRRVRAALEGSWECQPGGAGGCLTPSLEVGVRHDSGDARTGAGVEVGGDLRWTDRTMGLTLELRGRALVVDGDDHEDWGVGGLFRLDPGASGRGLSLRLSPGFGDSTGDVESLYDHGAFGAADGNATPSGRLDAEIGYGFATGDGEGLLTPYAGLSLAEEGARSWRVGGRLRIGPGLGVSLEGTRRENAAEDPDHGILLRGRINW